MAFPYLSYGAPGVLAAPPTNTNPIQNPLASPDDATVAAMAEARAKQSALQQALHRAAVLREEPLNAKGQGPMGARQGVGPMGWAVTLGDVVAGVIAKKKRERAGQEVTGAMGPLSASEQEYINQYLKSDPATMQALPRYGKPASSYIPQGSPLSLGD